MEKGESVQSYPMMQPNPLVRYVEAVETHFSRHFGKPCTFQPDDFKLLLQWFKEEMPLEAIRRGIDAAFDEARSRIQYNPAAKPSSIAFCQRYVLVADKALIQASVGTNKTGEDKDSWQR